MNTKEFIQGLVMAIKAAKEAEKDGLDKGHSADYWQGRQSAFEAILNCPAVQGALQEIKEAKHDS